jgi:hypothetical protein
MIGQIELMCNINCNILLRIWGSQRGWYENLCLLWCEPVWPGGSQQLFRKSISPPSSELEKTKQPTNIKETANNLSKMFTGRSCVKRSLQILKRRWHNNIQMNLREINCEKSRWMEMAQDHVRWWSLVLSIFNRRVRLPEIYWVLNTKLRGTECEDGRWMELAQNRVQWRTLGCCVDSSVSAARDLLSA